MSRQYILQGLSFSDVNQELLQAELNGAGYNTGLSWLPGTGWICNVFDSTTNPEIDAVLAVHNALAQTAEQQETEASEIAKTDIKAYLRSQLVNPSPNLATIKATIEAAVGGNAKAAQAISNTAALFGYDDATATGYVRCAYLVVALLT